MRVASEELAIQVTPVLACSPTLAATDNLIQMCIKPYDRKTYLVQSI